MSGVFPGAVSTFTVTRKTITLGINPTYGGFQTIATGVSVVMQDLQGVIADGRGALIVNAEFRASTFTDSPIQLNDVLLDEQDTNPDGSPVAFNVQGRSTGALSTILHLKKTVVGA